jgi:protein TonB
MVSQSENIRKVGSRAYGGMLQRGVIASLALHAAWVLGLLLLSDHAMPPGKDVESFELVMVPADPPAKSVTSPQGSAASPETVPKPDQQQALLQPAAPAQDARPDLVARPEEDARPDLDAGPGQQPLPDQQPTTDQQAASEAKAAALEHQPVQQQPVPDAAPEQPPEARQQAATEHPAPGAQGEPHQQPAPRAYPPAVIQEPPPPPSPRPARPPRPTRARADSPTSAPPARTHASARPGQTEPLAIASAAPGAVPSAASVGQQLAPAASNPDWLAEVGAWLLAHRSYPETARALGRQGTVVVQITVEQSGRVEEVNLLRGSGSDSLDHAAEALVRNAQLPPFPPDMKVPRQSVTVPIRYRLE